METKKKDRVRPDEWVHGEKKKQRSMMLTDSAARMLGQKALDLGITKSEVLERAIRSGGLDLADSFQFAKNN
jgi:hypothetical protein